MLVMSLVFFWEWKHEKHKRQFSRTFAMFLWWSCFQNSKHEKHKRKFSSTLAMQCFSDGLVLRTENMKSTQGNFPERLQCFSVFFFRTQNMKSTKGNFPALPNLTFCSNPNIRSTACWWEWIYTLCYSKVWINITIGQIIELLHFCLLNFWFKLAQMPAGVNENKLCKKLGIKKEYHVF